eukprot:m.297624 g.297624  ORF g.297624 m.297624 type:complete len:441 (+) comp40772_c0_seq10:397-1719(+)
MLLSFDFAYVKGSSCFREWKEDELSLDTENALCQLEEANACLLLPWLLNDKSPNSQFSEFPTECPRLWIEVDVFFSFGFSLPMGIFQQFSARCHRHSDLIQHWSSGFFFRHGPVLAEFTCKERNDNPEIHCRSRTPKSMNALRRLFHALWRCVIDLQKLLKNVPGCLYEIFMNYDDGYEILKKQKINVTEDRRLEAASGTNAGVVLRRCSQAADEVTRSIFCRQSLEDAYSNHLGTDASQYFTDVAMAVESHHCNKLALSLGVDCKGPAGSVSEVLKEWQRQRQRGSGAVIAVLSDALQKCKLHAVRAECFKDIHDIDQYHDEAALRTTDRLAKLPAGDSSVADHPYLRMAVAKVGNSKWKEICLCLGFQHYETSGGVLAFETDTRKLQTMIEKWSDDKGSRATVERLLNACQTEGISLDEVQRQYSTRLKLLGQSSQFN